MDKKFEYTYSAPTEEERREIESIRLSYSPKKESDIDRLKSLDKRVKNPPLILALIIGILGILTFGLGITFSTEWENIAVGIPVCAVGAVIMGVSYPVYKAFLSSRKKKYAAEILALSDKLLNTK